MVIAVSDISQAVRQAQDCFTGAENELNAADAKLGDGDTGGMLKRLADGVARVDLSSTDDLGIAFMNLAMAASTSTGSSLGTLVMTALMTLSKATRAQTTLAAERIPELISDICAAMLARGGATIGDKTVIDGLQAIAKALGDAEPSTYLAAAAQSANKALETFRDQPNRIGRARLYGDKSRGLDDPGMLALSKFCSALAADDPAGRPAT
ncbi:DAK2 domain-containing protein [Rhizobium sp. SYY.PMSO]|uniref:DAK2 domain-containing protein n=1 Tax=Rhizobium sp. SYY.PMSO TaxID=3382192 RepID=UPI00398FF9D2